MYVTCWSDAPAVATEGGPARGSRAAGYRTAAPVSPRLLRAPERMRVRPLGLRRTAEVVPQEPVAQGMLSGLAQTFSPAAFDMP